MAAMPLATSCEDFRGRAFHDPRTPLQKIGLDKRNAEQEEVYNMFTVERRRCDAVCMEPGADRKASTPFTSLVRSPVLILSIQFRSEFILLYWFGTNCGVEPRSIGSSSLHAEDSDSCSTP